MEHTPQIFSTIVPSSLTVGDGSLTVGGVKGSVADDPGAWLSPAMQASLQSDNVKPSANDDQGTGLSGSSDLTPTGEISEVESNKEQKSEELKEQMERSKEESREDHIDENQTLIKKCSIGKYAKGGV